MDTVVRYQVGGISSVLVEMDEGGYGVAAMSGAGQPLVSMSASVRHAAQSALDAMKKRSPEMAAVEFGIKLAGDAGMLIAKTNGEGHVKVRPLRSPGGEP